MIPVDRPVHAPRTLFLQIRIPHDRDARTSDITDMQIFVKGLRGTETFGIAQPEIDVGCRIIAHIGTWTENSLIHNAVFIDTPTDKEAPFIIFPLVLCIGAPYVYDLMQGCRRIFFDQFLQMLSGSRRIFRQGRFPVLLLVGGTIVQIVVTELDTSRQIGRHEEAFVKTVDILRSRHSCEIRRPAICAVITVTVDMLSGRIEAEVMFLVRSKKIKL